MQGGPGNRIQATLSTATCLLVMLPLVAAASRALFVTAFDHWQTVHVVDERRDALADEPFRVTATR